VLRNKNFNVDCMNAFQLIEEHKKIIKENNGITREKKQVFFKKQNEGSKWKKKKKKKRKSSHLTIDFTNTTNNKLPSLDPDETRNCLKHPNIY